LAGPVPPGLIVNADDLGIHPRINAGILSAYRHGILSSCTMLMTTAYFDQTVRDYVRPQALPIGVHLSLTLGKAVAPRGEVFDLVDEDGNLKLAADRLIGPLVRQRPGLRQPRLRPACQRRPRLRRRQPQRRRRPQQRLALRAPRSARRSRRR